MRKMLKLVSLLAAFAVSGFASAGVMMSDGVLISDGIMVSDGTMISD